MTVIGLTGGIASGKSTLSRFASENGAHVIDADLLGHRAYEPDTPCFHQVVKEFGQDVVAEDGSIDRKVLGAKVFSEGSSLTRLTDIVWPAIKSMAEAEIGEVKKTDPERLVVLEAAVLLEANWQDIVDEVWTVVVEEEVAIERAMTRDGSNREAVEARIRSQISNEERSQQSHVVIDNSCDEGTFKSRVAEEFRLLRERSEKVN